jgi:hypothetical protein
MTPTPQNTPSPTPANGKNPLLRFTGLQQLLNREAENPPSAQSIEVPKALPAIVSHFRASWGRNKLAKMNMDVKLLQCLRERRGVYSPAQIATMQASTGGGINFVKADLTETKCRAASAWIREIVIPVGEQAWGVDPDPIPELPDEIKKTIVQQALGQANQAMQQAAQAGAGAMTKQEFRDLAHQLGDKLRDVAETAMTKEAQKRAARMETAIAQRLDDGGYEHALDGFIEDFVTYPAAILKGPIYKRHHMLEWGAGWVPKVSYNPLQSWERVSPFDIYPAPSSSSPQHGDFIERIRFQREELHALKGLPNYKDDEIDDALYDYANGHLEGWLWTEAERQRLEQESLYMWLTPPGVIDALNCWGSVPGWKLMTWGITSADGQPLEDTRDYECNVLLCGAYVLYAALNPDPLNKRPYRKACYDEIPGAFWGRSIPDLCATSQRMCDGIACAVADNLSMASGPMVWVHADRFADGETSQAIYPWRLWQLKSDPTQGVNPGIGYFQVNDISTELMNAYDKWELKADDASGIPRYTYGNERAGGSADTATGLSMLMNNAAKGLRRAISNIDMNVISQTIGATFVNEMLYNPDESIKGACRVVPRGAAAILIKESAQQRRMQWAQLTTGNPVIANLLGQKYIAESLRLVAASLEMPVDDVVPSEDEIDASMQAQAQAQQAQAQGAVQAQAAQEQAIGARESQLETQKLLGKIVAESVSNALASQGTKKGKRVVHKFGPDGSMTSEVEDPEQPLVSPIAGQLVSGVQPPPQIPQPAGA